MVFCWCGCMKRHFGCVFGMVRVVGDAYAPAAMYSGPQHRARSPIHRSVLARATALVTTGLEFRRRLLLSLPPFPSRPFPPALSLPPFPSRPSLPPFPSPAPPAHRLTPGASAHRRITSSTLYSSPSSCASATATPARRPPSQEQRSRSATSHRLRWRCGQHDKGQQPLMSGEAWCKTN